MLSRFPLGRCSHWFPEMETDVVDGLTPGPRPREWTGPCILQAPHSKWVASLMKGIGIGIGTNIEVTVAWLTTWEAHHKPTGPSARGELPRSLIRPQWLQYWYQFVFCYGETKLIINKQILSKQMLTIIPQTALITSRLHMCICWGSETWLLKMFYKISYTRFKLPHCKHTNVNVLFDICHH